MEKINSYIFISTEGFTYQPNSESIDPDISNCQVIGFADGKNQQKAFENLLKEKYYLTETNFDELICYELKNSDKKYFRIKQSRTSSI